MPSALEAHLGLMFELLDDPVGVHSGGRLVAINPACLRLFRYDDGAHLLGRSLLELVSPSEHARIADYVRRRETAAPPPTRYVTRGIRSDATEFDLEVALTTFVHDGTPFAIVRMRDVTTEQEIARALRESDEKFRLLTSQALVGIYILQDDRVVFANAGVGVITGFSVEEMTSWKVIDFARMIHPDDVAFVTEQGRRKQAGEEGATDAYGYRLLHRDGTARFVEQHSRSVMFGGRPASLGVIMDVTARKRAEESAAELEEALRQSQKMEAIGRLAGGIAHDFNNLLTAILGSLGLANEPQTSDDERRQAIVEAIAASERAATLTRSLLAFSRKQVLDPRPLDVASLMRTTERIIGRVLGEHVLLAIDLPTRPATIVGDEAHLVQVIVNLAINARDAMPDGGRLDLHVEPCVLDALEAARRELPAGSYVRLDVRDTGHGIPPEVLEHVFDPFFTTKPIGQGTGLGLSVAFGVVKQLGGAITVTSEVGRGSCFTVHLPATTSGASVRAEKDGSTASMTTGATILLVEDEDLVRQIAQRALERAGYRVLSCEDAAAALAAVARHNGDVDLLFTDVMMPGMNGPELARRLVADRPSLAVLFTSGYTHDVLGDRLPAGTALLSKPYTSKTLLEAIRERLGRDA